MSKHQEGRLSFQQKKLMAHVLSWIESETNYPTANIKIPTTSYEDFEEFKHDKVRTVVDLLKPLEGKASASENAQQIIIDNLSINHEQMLDDLEQLQFQSGLRGEEINYILAELAKIYNDLKANKDYSNPAATVFNDNNQDDQPDSEAMIPDFLYTLQIPQNIPATNTTKNAPENKPVNKDKPATNYKIEIILNQPYRAFALRVKEHLNLAFNENYIQLTNRAYKLLIIQFHSLILKDKSIAYNPLLNDIRNRFCHKWDMIGHSNDLQVHLHHILFLIEQTQDGSLLSIQNLDKELSNYPQKILALEKNANPIYRGKASATEKMKTLLQEFDETSKLSSDQEFGKLAQLALIDILCDIGETLTHCSISNVNPLWANVRTTGYHSDTPAQETIDVAVAKGIP